MPPLVIFKVPTAFELFLHMTISPALMEPPSATVIVPTASAL